MSCLCRGDEWDTRGRVLHSNYIYLRRCAIREKETLFYVKNRTLIRIADVYRLTLRIRYFSMHFRLIRCRYLSKS